MVPDSLHVLCRFDLYSRGEGVVCRILSIHKIKRGGVSISSILVKCKHRSVAYLTTAEHEVLPHENSKLYTTKKMQSASDNAMDSNRG